jgi:hypothetical protein
MHMIPIQPWNNNRPDAKFSMEMKHMRYERLSVRNACQLDEKNEL